MNWKIMKRVTAILLTILLVMSNMALVWADDSNGDGGEPIAEEHFSAVSMTGYVLPDGTPAFMDEDGNYPEEAVSTVDLENNAVTWYIKIEAKEGSVYPLTNVLLRDDWGQYAVNNWQTSGNLVADRCLDYEGAVVIGEATGQVYMPGTDYTAAQEIRVETSTESGEEIEVGGPIEFAFPAITEPIIVAMTATFPVELEGNCNFTNGISVQDLDYYGYTGASADIVYTPSKPDDPYPQNEQSAAVYVTGYTLPDGTPAFMDADGNYPEGAISTVLPADGTMTWYVKVEAEEGSEYPLSDVSVRDNGGQYMINNWQVFGDIIAERCLDYEEAVVIGENSGTTYTPGEDYSVRQEQSGVDDEGNQIGGPIEFTFPTISEPIIIAIPMVLPVKIIGNYNINNRVSVQDSVTYRYIEASAEVTGEYMELAADLTGAYDEDSRVVTWKAILNPAKVAIEPVNDLVEFSAVIPEGMELVNFDDPTAASAPTIRVQYQGNVWGEMFFDVIVTEDGIAPMDIRHYWEQTWFDPPEKAYDCNVSGTEYIVEYKTRITDEEWEQLAYTSGGSKVYTNSVMFTDGGEITLQEECCVAIEREVSNPITFIEQPESCEHAIGEKVSLVAEAEGEGLAYQWQYLKPGAEEWKNSGLSSAKNSVLTFKMSAGYDGMQFRCKVTDSNGNEGYSEAAAITMIDRSYITKQPEDVVASIGTKAAFSIETNRDDLTYQWQFQKVGSTKWVNSTSAGNKTDSMKVSATAGTNGMKFRCVVTDAEGYMDVSEEVQLTAVPKPEITVQPESVNAVIGNRVKLKVSATGSTELTYQWQYQKPGTDTWKKSGLSSATLSTLSFKMSEAYDGYKFRCKVADAYGASVYSDAAAIAIAE